MSESDSCDVLVPGLRDVRGTLDNAGGTPDGPDPKTVVVACPPHPQYGGRRTDTRLQAVSDALTPEMSCLRFDYGEWAEGEGELADARSVLRWARKRFDRVGVFGYSFGGAVALLTTARAEPPPEVVSVLAPTANLGAGLDAAAALDDIKCPAQVVYGERDTTADWEPIVERARGLGYEVEAMSSDHHFVGQADRVAASVATFLRRHF